MQSCFPTSILSYLPSSWLPSSLTGHARQAATGRNATVPNQSKIIWERLHHWDKRPPIPLPRCRYRSLTLPLVLDNSGHSHKYVHDQCQSALFCKLPPEIRERIYQEVLADPDRVIHITLLHERMGHVRCWGESDELQLNWQHPCWGQEHESGVHNKWGEFERPQQNLLALLRSCHRMYVPTLPNI